MNRGELRRQLDEIVDQRNEMDGRIEAFLRNAGWTASSNWPDAVWRWTRRLEDGRTISLSRDAALRFEEATLP